MYLTTYQWVLVYIVFYAAAIASITMSSIALNKAATLPCLDCPNGKPGQNGTNAICDNCCGWDFDNGHYKLGASNIFMYWTNGNVISGTINQSQGWAFTNERSFSMTGQTDSILLNSTLFNFPLGVWQFTYEISLQLGTTTILYKNSTISDTDTLSGSTTLQTWISGITIQNITEPFQSYIFSTNNPSARAVRPGPAGGLPLIRFTAIQYTN